MSNNPILQHYLPQWYQRNFAKDGRVFAVRLSDSDPKVLGAITPRNVAAVGDLYTITAPDGSKDYSVEKALSELEGAAAGATQRLLRDGPSALGRDRSVLAEYLAFQLLRTTFVRNQLDSMVAELFTSYGVSDDIVPSGEPTQRGVELVKHRGKVKFGNGSHVELMEAGAWDLAPLLFERPWGLVSLPSPQLITSDHPVSLWDGSVPTGQPLSPRDAAQLRWPIDPMHALVLGRRGEMGEGLYPALLGGEQRVAAERQLRLRINDNYISPSK